MPHLFHPGLGDAVAGQVVGGGDLVLDVQGHEEVPELANWGPSPRSRHNWGGRTPRRVQAADDGGRGQGVKLAYAMEAGVPVDHHQPVLAATVEDVGAQRIHGEEDGHGARGKGGGVGGAEGLADITLSDEVVDVPSHPRPEVELAGCPRCLGDASVCSVEEE